MKKYKKGILIFLCLVVIGSLVACQSKKVPNKDIGETKETESNLKKDELIVSMGERIPHEFDPKQRWGMYNEAHIIHSTLLMKTADLDIVGDLAKDYSI